MLLINWSDSTAWSEGSNMGRIAVQHEEVLAARLQL
jgi:hypothetical protein